MWLPGVSVAPPGNDERVGGITFKLALDDPPPIGGIGLKSKRRNSIQFAFCSFQIESNRCDYLKQFTESAVMNFDWTLNGR